MVGLILDFYGVIFDPKTRGAMNGLREFLDAIQLHGIPCAIASSSSKETIQAFLVEEKLDHYFTAIIGLNEVSATKPDPECYITAAQHLGLSPADCVVVDDSLQCITAAKQAGFKTLYFGASLDNFQKISTLLSL